MVAPSGLVQVPCAAGAVLPEVVPDVPFVLLFAVPFETVTLSEATWETFPDVSVDLAEMVWLPFAVVVESQDHDQEAVPEAFCHEPPSTDTCTFATATLSEADPETATVADTVDPAPGEAMETVGATVSGTGLLTPTDSDTTVEMFPEVSLERAEIVWLPLASPLVFHCQLQLVVPVAVCHEPLSMDTWTFATATLSAADPDTVTVPDTVFPAAGELSETLGGVVSADDWPTQDL